MNLKDGFLEAGEEARRFVLSLQLTTPTQAETAVILIWYLTQGPEQMEVTVGELTSHLRGLGLWSKVDQSRLRTSLGRRKEVVRGRRADAFRIRADKRAALGETYAVRAAQPNTPGGGPILSTELTFGGRRHLQRLRAEINGTYESEFFNSCAVMCRRLAESLLIEVFVAGGHLGAISNADGGLKGLGDIIAIASSGSLVRLSRSTPRTLERIKAIGDAAAHSRYHLVSREEIEAANPGFRQTISELSIVAGLES